jgi:hypothetical protein
VSGLMDILLMSKWQIWGCIFCHPLPVWPIPFILSSLWAWSTNLALTGSFPPSKATPAILPTFQAWLVPHTIPNLSESRVHVLFLFNLSWTW